MSIAGAAEVPCYATLDNNEDINFIPVSFNISAFPDNNETNLTVGVTYKFKIWTVGAEDGINGFVSPSVSGWYPITISGKDQSFASAEKVVDFSYVRGPSLGFFDISAAIRNYGAKNLFTFRFYLPSGTTLNAYNHATKPGRIFIEFSTIN